MVCIWFVWAAFTHVTCASLVSFNNSASLYTLDLFTYFHGDAFCVFGHDELELDLADVVGFAAKAGYQVDKTVLHELSDQGVLFFDDQRWCMPATLLHSRQSSGSLVVW